MVLMKELFENVYFEKKDNVRQKKNMKVTQHAASGYVVQECYVMLW